MLEGTLLYASELAKGATSIWFVSWAVRRHYDVDVHLTRKEQAIRWGAVSVGLGLAFLPGPGFSVVRIMSGVIALGFLAWPNFARSLVEFLAKLHITKED